MEMTILEEKENKFLNRKELKVKLKHQGTPTPSKAEIAKEMAAKYSVEEKQVVIGYIFSIKGIGESIAEIKIVFGDGKNEAQASKAK